MHGGPTLSATYLWERMHAEKRKFDAITDPCFGIVIEFVAGT